MSVYQVINKFIFDNALIFSVIVPVVTGMLSGVISYLVTIKSEKRKEFNKALYPTILLLHRSLCLVKEKNFTGLKTPTTEMLISLNIHLPPKKHKQFSTSLNLLLDEIKLISKNKTPTGSIDYSRINNCQHKKIIELHNKLIRILKLK